MVSLVTRRFALVGLLGVWALLSARQVPVWTNHRTLWTHALALTPNHPRVVLNYGRALDLGGDLEGADAAYLLAIGLATRLPPEARGAIDAIAASNRGHLALARHDIAGALRILNALNQEDPTFQPGQINRAIALTLAGSCVEADALWTTLHIAPQGRPRC